MEITISEAAERLGVSTRQVQRLVESGRIQKIRKVGSSFLVDDTGIQRVANARRGRTWASHTAWAAIDLLELGSTKRIHGSSLSRLNSRLRSIDAVEFVRLAARRATTWRGIQTRRTKAQLKESTYLSGESLLSDPSVAHVFGLPAMESGTLEGYVTSDQWEATMTHFGLVADGEGDVLIHVTKDFPTVGIVTCALDLAEQQSARERSAALHVLSERLVA